MQRRWLVTGAGGLLGRDLVDVLARAAQVVTSATRADLDVTDIEATRRLVAGHDVVVNCAAFTAVDEAEHREGDAFAVNALGAAHLADACRMHRVRLVHLSTDYVFDGNGNRPYRASDPVSPVSAYGRTKAAGEWAVRAMHDDVLVLRTAWLYGRHGRCFPRTVATALREGVPLTVVDDQFGQPTWSRDVADLVLRLVEATVPAGTYHATSGGRTSWWEFAREVVRAAGGDPSSVVKTRTVPGVRAARRPASSVLDHDTVRDAGVTPIGEWRERWVSAAGVVLS